MQAYKQLAAIVNFRKPRRPSFGEPVPATGEASEWGVSVLAGRPAVRIRMVNVSRQAQASALAAS
jgi:hypothetical protein